MIIQDIKKALEQQQQQFFRFHLYYPLGVYQGALGTFLIDCLIVFTVSFTLIYILIYVQKVNKIRKTFLKAVKRGYLEWYNEYEDKLYEYVEYMFDF